MEALAIGATASRGVLGCMNDAARQFEAIPRGPTEVRSLQEVARHLAENIYSLTKYQTPRLKALELFGVMTGVQRVRQGPWLH